MSKILTTDEKIDYIYDNIRKNKRNGIIKGIIRLTILGFVIFGYYTLMQNFSKEEIINKLSEQVSEIAEPIVKNMVKNLGNQDAQSQQDTVNNFIKNNPELIEQLRN